MGDDEIEKRIGRHLRERRLLRRWSQTELAELANVSVGAVKSLEAGAGSTVGTLAKVLRALGAESWVEALAPPVRVSPLALAEEQRRALAAPRRRVRRVG